MWRETGWDEKGRRCARVRKLVSNFTYICEGKKRNGASNIDHIGLNYRELHRVESFEIRNDIWDVCNTAHRSVIATLKAQGEKGNMGRERGWGEEKAGRGVEGRRNKREITMNKVANVRVWEEYRKRCDRDARVDMEAAGICSANGVEEGWSTLKQSMWRLEAVARDIYKCIGKAQKVRMGRVVEYNTELRRLKRDRVAARRKLDRKLKPDEQPNKWRAFKRAKNRMKKVAYKRKMQLLEEEADELDRLGKKHAGIQWRQVKSLVPRKARNLDFQSALDCRGNVVYGEAVLGVWKDAYEKLGREGVNLDFDEEWKEQVEGEVERMEAETENQGANCDLDGVITLVEVKKTVKELKARIAAGKDG